MTMLGGFMGDIWGVRVRAVEPGTVVKKGDEQLVVDDRNFVVDGPNMYCTPLMVSWLKAALQ
jgi:hypothetical protein